MKRFNFTTVLTALLAAVSVGMTTVPALASNSTHNFTFNFDYGNTDTTDIEYKDSDHAVTMYCTGSDELSGSSYNACVKTTGGRTSAGYNISSGGHAIMYCGDFEGSNIYIQGKLNSNDVDSFWGYWNPDDPQY